MVDKEWLNYLTKSKKTSQEKIAEQMGISREAYQNRLSGDTRWNQEDIQKLIKILDLKVADVIKIWFKEEFLWKPSN